MWNHGAFVRGWKLSFHADIHLQERVRGRGEANRRLLLHVVASLRGATATLLPGFVGHLQIQRCVVQIRLQRLQKYLDKTQVFKVHHALTFFSPCLLWFGTPRVFLEITMLIMCSGWAFFFDHSVTTFRFESKSITRLNLLTRCLSHGSSVAAKRSPFFTCTQIS